MSPEIPEPVEDRIPDWIIHPDLVNRSTEIGEWYKRYEFHRIYQGNPENLHDAYVLSRVLGEAHLAALGETANLMADMETAFVGLAVEAKQRSLYRWGEYESTRELLEDKLERALKNSQGRSGRLSELRNLITVVDMLEKMGVPKEYVAALPTNISKARESTQPMLDIINSTAKQEEKTKAIKEILVDVADPEVSFREFQKRVDQRMGKVTKRRAEPAPADFCILPGGKEVIVIYPRDKEQTTAISHAVKGLTTPIEVRDPVVLLKELTQASLPHSNNLVHAKLNPMLYTLELGVPDCVYLPAQDAMTHMILSEVTRYLPIYSQLQHEIEFPVFTIARGLPDKFEDFVSWMENAFRCKFERNKDGELVGNPMDILATTIKHHYGIPQDAIDFVASYGNLYMQTGVRNQTLAVSLLFIPG